LDDYLSEAEQWEWLKGQIREYGLWILGGVLLGAAGIGAWFAWQSHTNSVGMAASAQYEDLRRAFSGPDRGQAMAKLGELEREHPGSPYVDQARLVAARAFIEAGELDKGANELQRVADTSRDRQLAQIARLRLARVQIAKGQGDAAIATLNVKDPGAFAARFHEVRGDAYYARGDKKNALQEYQAAQLSSQPGGGPAGGGNDQSLLELKVADLVAQVPSATLAPAAPAAPVTGAITVPPATPPTTTPGPAPAPTPGPAK